MKIDISEFLDMPRGPERAGLGWEILKSLEANPAAMADQLVSALDSDEWHKRKMIAELLLTAGDSCLVTVQRALRSDNENKRYWGMWILRQLGTKKAFDIVIKFLKSNQKSLRSHALEALAGYTRVKSALPHLISCLDDREWTFRAKAVDLICEIGKPALPMLKKAYIKASPDGKYWIIRAIGMILKNSGEDISPLLKIMVDGDKRSRMHVMTGLGGMPDPRFIKILVELLADDEWMVRSQASETLIDIGEPAVKACAAAVSKGKDIGDQAYWGIKVVATIRQEQAVPWFKKLLKANPLSEELRFYILDAITLCHNESMADFLIELFNDPFWNIRRKSHIILRGFPERFIPVIVNSLQDAVESHEDDRAYWLVSTLIGMGRAGLVPVIRLFEASSDNIRRLIMSQLVECGIRDPMLMEMCIEALEDPIWTIRSQAAKIIEGFGHSAISPLVTAFYKHTTGDRGYWTECILKSAGKKYEELLEKLQKENEVESLAHIGGHIDDNLLLEETPEPVQPEEGEHEDQGLDISIFFNYEHLSPKDISIVEALKSTDDERKMLGINKLTATNDFHSNSVAFLMEPLFDICASDNDKLSVLALRTIRHIVEISRAKMVSLAVTADPSIQSAIDDLTAILKHEEEGRDHSPGFPSLDETVSDNITPCTVLSAILCLASESAISRLAGLIEYFPASSHLLPLLTAVSMLPSADTGRIALKYATNDNVPTQVIALFALENRAVITNVPELTGLINSPHDRVKSAFMRLLCCFEEKSLINALKEAANSDMCIKKQVLSLFSQVLFSGIKPLLLDWTELAENEELLLCCLDSLMPVLDSDVIPVAEKISSSLGLNSPAGARAHQILAQIEQNYRKSVRSFISYKSMDYYHGLPKPESDDDRTVDEKGDFTLDMQAILDRRDELKKHDEMKMVLAEMCIRIGETMASRINTGEIKDEKCRELAIQLTKYNYFIQQRHKNRGPEEHNFMGLIKGALDSAGIATGSRDSKLEELKKHRLSILEKLGATLLDTDLSAYNEDYDLQSLLSQAKSIRSKLNAGP